MATSSSTPSSSRPAGGGINRSALRNASGTPRPAPVERPLPASAAVRAKPQAVESDLVYFFKAVGWMSAALLGALALWALVFLMRDSMAAGSALAEAKQQRSTLVCQAGHMSHGDGSLHDLVFADAAFVCDDWKTLEAIKEDEIKAQAPQIRTTAP